MRRVIKPFVIEVRGHGRKARAAGPTPAWPELDEQPVVEWPRALLTPVADPEPVLAEPAGPTGRILPDLAELERRSILAAGSARAVPRRKKAAVEMDEPDDKPEGPELPAAAALEPEQAEALPVNATADAVPTLPRRMRKRPKRDGFARGERWKARLPAAALRAGSKRARAPKIYDA